ncbi:MAG: hypothetical protein WCQ96_03040 [Patescibacteria group bacterium]
MEINKEEAQIIANLLVQVTVKLSDAPVFLALQEKVNQAINE